MSASTLQGIAAILGVHPGSFFDGGPLLLRAVPDLRADNRIAERIQRIRDPGVIKRVMALVDLLAESNGKNERHPADSVESR